MEKKRGFVAFDNILIRVFFVIILLMTLGRLCSQTTYKLPPRDTVIKWRNEGLAKNLSLEQWLLCKEYYNRLNSSGTSTVTFAVGIKDTLDKIALRLQLQNVYSKDSFGNTLIGRGNDIHQNTYNMVAILTNGLLDLYDTEDNVSVNTLSNATIGGLQTTYTTWQSTHTSNHIIGDPQIIWDGSQFVMFIRFR